ncbi:rod shape-determining protein [Geoglobus acetivorans]|uniref:Rod shape-determining protein n=1 Tax=Geoglobus acetivorans TaxID=565033 RepID=A0ABZ3H3H1_GEOAI|nr:rod shape-determining protein [Geoglobus acetivorans]
MKFVGLDIGTNYTKATADGENVIIFPSLVVYGEEKEWSLKGTDEREVYVGDEAAYMAQNMENVEVLRPLHEGRLMHGSYIELAKHALNLLGVDGGCFVTTGLPVKSSKKERAELVDELKNAIGADVLLLPQPVGSMAYMNLKTGVCIDIGFGTTDVVVLADMEYLKGDTMLVGVDKVYDTMEMTIRNRFGISITPEEMTRLLSQDGYEVGRVRGGKKIVVRKEDIQEEYSRVIEEWVERIVNRVNMLLEGLSVSLVENIVLSGGGAKLPGVYEKFAEHFRDIGEIKVPDDPVTANARGFHRLARTFRNESAAEGEREKSDEADVKEKKSRKKK